MTFITDVTQLYVLHRERWLSAKSLCNIGWKQTLCYTYPPTRFSDQINSLHSDSERGQKRRTIYFYCRPFCKQNIWNYFLSSYPVVTIAGFFVYFLGSLRFLCYQWQSSVYERLLFVWIKVFANTSTFCCKKCNGRTRIISDITLYVPRQH